MDSTAFRGWSKQTCGPVPRSWILRYWPMSAGFIFLLSKWFQIHALRYLWRAIRLAFCFNLITGCAITHQVEVQGLGLYLPHSISKKLLELAKKFHISLKSKCFSFSSTVLVFLDEEEWSRPMVRMEIFLLCFSLNTRLIILGLFYWIGSTYLVQGQKNLFIFILSIRDTIFSSKWHRNSCCVYFAFYTAFCFISERWSTLSVELEAFDAHHKNV